MRKLSLTADQFDTFVFPYVAQSNAQNDAEFETALRLLRKLKDPALTMVAPLSDPEEKARQAGAKVFAFNKLRESEASFVLEEDEWKLLQARLAAYKTKVNIVALEDFAALLDVIKAAPEFKPEAPLQIVEAKPPLQIEAGAQ